MSWADENLSEADVAARIDVVLAAGDQSLVVGRRANQLLRQPVSERVVVFDWTLVADGVIDYE